METNETTATAETPATTTAQAAEVIIREDENLKVTQDSVEVKVPGRDEKVSKDYERMTAKTLAGALALCDGDEATVLGHFNYGFDLAARQRNRASVLADNVDPEVIIARTVNGMVKAGFPEAQARELVIAQRKAQGLPVPAEK